MSKATLIILTVICFSFVSFADLSSPIDYSGDYVMLSDNEVIPFKLYVQSSGKMRMDFQNDNGKTSAIIRPDKNVIWNLSPQNTCIELPLEGIVTESYMPPSQYLVDANKIGAENLLGYPCDIFRFKVGPYNIMVWISREKGIMLRSRMEEATRYVVFEAKKVRFNKQPDDLFEIPAGYQLIPQTALAE